MECSHYECNELHLCLTSENVCREKGLLFVCKEQTAKEQVDVCEEVQLDGRRLQFEIFHFNKQLN